MSEYGVDLAVWFRNRRWVAILDYIDMLPSPNRLTEAMMNDPEYAMEIAMRPESEDSWSPPFRDYNLQAVMMREVITKLEVVIQTLTASGGAKPKSFKPFPTPVTEVDRAKEKLERQHVVGIAEMVGFSESDFY